MFTRLMDTALRRSPLSKEVGVLEGTLCKGIVMDIPEKPNLRDFFAAAVISGIFAGNWGQMPNRKPEQAFADIAYLVADEMLKRRLK